MDGPPVPVPRADTFEMSLRKPLLCLDTNASIDIGAVDQLGCDAESLDERHRKAEDTWAKLSYDQGLKEHIAGIFRSRHDQLAGTARFLHLARDRSSMRLPEFVKRERERVVSGPERSIPDFTVEPLTPGVHELSLDLFSRTSLDLQDALVLASAVDMRADVLVSNDDDFKRAFNEGVASIASEITRKPFLLVDHRLPLPRRREERPSLHGMLLESLGRHYRGHPSLGRPLWVDREGGTGDWYLAYQHPVPFEESGLARIVPGTHGVSILDGDTWTVCKVESIRYYEESCPEGVTPDSIRRIRQLHAAGEQEQKKSFRPPKNGDDPGYVRISIALKEFPSSWNNWGTQRKGARAATKRHAPKGALGFVEVDEG